jgi:hypothetical protein
MTFPIEASISGSVSYTLVQPIGWTVFETWDYCWQQTGAGIFSKPANFGAPYNWYAGGPAVSGMRRIIAFFDTTGISQDLVLGVYVTTSGVGGGQFYVLNGNGADPDFGAEIFGWIRGRFSVEYLIASKDMTALTEGKYHYFLIPAAHINSSGYTVLLFVHSSDYGHSGSPTSGVICGRPQMTLGLSPAGYIWVEGTKIAYVDGNYAKRTQEGSLDGATGKIAGHLWAEGSNLRYIDSSGNERYIAGTQEGAAGKIAGHIWIEATKFRYIDSNGDERCFEGTAP